MTVYRMFRVVVSVENRTTGEYENLQLNLTAIDEDDAADKALAEIERSYRRHNGVIEVKPYGS